MIKFNRTKAGETLCMGNSSWESERNTGASCNLCYLFLSELETRVALCFRLVTVNPEHTLELPGRSLTKYWGHVLPQTKLNQNPGIDWIWTKKQKQTNLSMWSSGVGVENAVLSTPPFFLFKIAASFLSTTWEILFKTTLYFVIVEDLQPPRKCSSLSMSTPSPVCRKNKLNPSTCM